MIKNIHAILVIAFGAFFIYSGVKKFIAKKARPQNNTELIQAIESNEYPNPLPFRLAVKMFKISGFLYFVGILQILSGLLMFFPKTRLIGLLVLLPITVNIFGLHLFMDNRMDENIKTGLLLLVNLTFISFYYNHAKHLYNAKL